MLQGNLRQFWAPMLTEVVKLLEGADPTGERLWLGGRVLARHLDGVGCCGSVVRGVRVRQGVAAGRAGAGARAAAQTSETR